MATILSLVSGLFGFVAGLGAYFVFDASALMAFAIWSLSGVTMTFLAIGIAMMPFGGHREEAERELA